MGETEEVGDKLVVSKEKMAVVPKSTETKEIIRIENNKYELWEEIKKAISRKMRVESQYDLRIGARVYAEAVSTLFFGGLDIGMAMSMITGLEIRRDPLPILITSNIAFGSILFICEKSRLKLKREKKKVQVDFDMTRDTIQKEIERQNNIENKIPGDNVSLTTSYVKIKSL